MMNRATSPTERLKPLPSPVGQPPGILSVAAERLESLQRSHDRLLECCEACVSCITTHANNANLNTLLMARLEDFLPALAEARGLHR